MDCFFLFFFSKEIIEDTENLQESLKIKKTYQAKIINKEKWSVMIKVESHFPLEVWSKLTKVAKRVTGRTKSLTVSEEWWNQIGWLRGQCPLSVQKSGGSRLQVKSRYGQDTHPFGRTVMSIPQSKEVCIHSLCRRRVSQSKIIYTNNIPNQQKRTDQIQNAKACRY